jgi:hypothetical protein
MMMLSELRESATTKKTRGGAELIAPPLFNFN